MLFLKIFLYYISYYIYPDPRPRPKVPKRHTKWQKKFGAAGMFYSFFFQNVGAADSLFFVALSSKIWGSNKQKTKKKQNKRKTCENNGPGLRKKICEQVSGTKNHV